MSILVLSMLLTSPLADTQATDFPREVRMAAAAATVRIRNDSRAVEGSGAILGREGPSVYVLTARHLVHGADRLEVSTFTVKSHPQPEATYRSVTVVAETNEVTDLALLRVTTRDQVPGSLKVCPLRAVPGAESFPALALGCPDGKAPAGLADRVLGKKRLRRQAGGDAAWFWEVAGKHATGRSGGALVDRRGYLIGTCSGTSRDRSYFCHAEEIHAFLKRSGFQRLLRGDAVP